MKMLIALMLLSVSMAAVCCQQQPKPDAVFWEVEHVDGLHESFAADEAHVFRVSRYPDGSIRRDEFKIDRD